MSGLRKQDVKAFLREVMIIGEDVCKALLAHHLHRDTVRETICLVWTCSHDTGHIWEEILPHPSESMSRTLKDLERQAFTVFWGMIRLSH